MTIGTNYNLYPNYNSYPSQAYGSAARAGNAGTPGMNPEESDKLRLSGEKGDDRLRLPGQDDEKKGPDGKETTGKTPAEKADPDYEKKAGRKSSPADCETCKTRKYQDGSDEANVSFKSAAHISPNAAGAAVRAHESEHVTNAYNKAAKNNGKVLSATVSIHTAICPECGRSYVSGGTTNTMIKYTNEKNPYQKELKSADATRFRGMNLDLSA